MAVRPDFPRLSAGPLTIGEGYLSSDTRVGFRQVVKEGNWTVLLDAGNGEEHTIEIGGAANLQVGEILPGTQYGRTWRIDHVSDLMFARAVPVDDD